MYKFFKEQLDSKIENHNLRTLREYCPLDAVRVKRDDKEYLMMASNNYLGLTFDTRVIEGALKGAQQYGTPTTPLHFFSHRYMQFLPTALHKI